jgi:nickel/cobalt transporter (NicO) family protein
MATSTGTRTTTIATMTTMWTPTDADPGCATQSRRNGVAGGLVPSPSALIVLLGAVGLGRTAFGVLLVLAYGIGMAATLTAAGLVLVRVRDRWTLRSRRTLARVAALAPTGTAVLVLCVGLAGRASLAVIH